MYYNRVVSSSCCDSKIVLMVVLCVMTTISETSIVPCGNEPCASNMDLGPPQMLRGPSTIYGVHKEKHVPSETTKAKGLIDTVNVTIPQEPEKIVEVNASSREDLEISSYHCDQGEFLFEDARKTWIDEMQQILPGSCSTSSKNENQTAVRQHQSISENLEMCVQDMGKLIKVISPPPSLTSQAVQKMIMSKQAFECCAENVGGGSSCKVDATSASELVAAITKSDEAIPSGDPIYISCKQYCKTSPYFKHKTQIKSIHSKKERETSDLKHELRNIFGDYDNTTIQDNDDTNENELSFVPPEETVYFAGCIQGCMGRLADAKNKKLSQIGCENYVEKMPCKRHDQCRWDGKKKLCLGLMRRCDRYCEYTSDEVDTSEYVKYDQREDEPVAKKRWYQACVFGCNLKRDPDGKIRAKDPCHVAICEDDPSDLLANEIFDCSVLMSISEGECDVRLSAFTRTRELQSVKISDTCPNSCGVCKIERFAECNE